MSAAFNRVWAMPSKDTFSVRPIGDFVRKYLAESAVSVDPFARNNTWATHTNDINPQTSAQHHMDAVAFLRMLQASGVKADLVILDPPYSPRQISECYREIGKPVGMVDTQSSVLYMQVKEAAAAIAGDDCVVLSFGWNSVGMGKKHGFEPIEYLLCSHVGAHNDTICVAERKVKELF
jgi:hypothetical protein